jgi:hypothetical protein
MSLIVAKKRVKGRPKVSEPKTPIASFRGSKAFALWFEGLVEHCRFPASSVIEKALIAYAKSEGFDEEPPRR